jgi:hypothetical protein
VNEDVGASPWGINSTAHVECGSGDYAVPRLRQLRKFSLGEEPSREQ